MTSPGFATETSVRLAQPADLRVLAPLLAALWPESPVAEDKDGSLVGFLECGLRSHADGCNPSRPVGYVEGWYVAQEYRQRGIGKSVLAAAEEWAQGQGCVEMASDAVIDNVLSQDVHQRLGSEVVERSVLFRKALQ